MNGNSNRVELLLHPVRIRIAGEFSGRSRSIRELAAALPDVPQTTLYRQVGVLLDGGLLEVVEARPTAGPAERVYQVAPGAGRISPDEADRLSPDEHLRYFSVYAASLVDTFAAYITSRDATPSADGLSYRRAVVHVSDEERATFSARFTELVDEVLALPPAPGRRRHVIASAAIPYARSPS